MDMLITLKKLPMTLEVLQVKNISFIIFVRLMINLIPDYSLKNQALNRC